MVITQIDSRYAIKIKDNGGSVTLLRNNEGWAYEPPYSKMFIAIAHLIETEKEKKSKAIEILKDGLHEKYSDDPSMECHYNTDPMKLALDILEGIEQ